ncbi:MAG: 4Fe-4S dicluster domain-containing protein, partial [Candidatus Heimdallarchaeota archaeon]|nr:4Fe-4S dicluster domain-containing protein [Candidatus Heimdallarchaeota archaeon]
KYDDVTYDEKKRLYLEARNDPRWPHNIYGCYECGICVAACPSARFYDFSPRKFAQAASREDFELLYEMMNDDVWECSQCYSCTRCPRQNSPGGIITLLREVAVNNGLSTARKAMEGYERVIYKIMATGTQVTPDMLKPDAFPDWGPEVKETAENLDVLRKAIPDSVMHTTETAWKVGDKTILELYMIWAMTGALDIVSAVDENLAMIIEEIMEDKLEEAGYDLSDFTEDDL